MNTQCIIHDKIIDDDTCNCTKFCGFVRELVSILRDKEDLHDAWLIMDNVRIHKTEEFRQIISNSPNELKFLSPYSCMLNSIENVFSKVKSSPETYYFPSEYLVL